MAATSEDNLRKAIDDINRDIPNVKDRVISFAVDVGNPRDVQGWIEATCERWGDLDGAANIAGISLV